MISRKPRHFACIIHSNSPGVSPRRPPEASSNQPPRPKRSNVKRDHFAPLFSAARATVFSVVAVGIAFAKRRHRSVLGPRLHFDIYGAPLTIYLRLLRARSILMLALIYIVLTFAERSSYALCIVRSLKCRNPTLMLLPIFFYSKQFRHIPVKNRRIVHMFSIYVCFLLVFSFLIF